MNFNDLANKAHTNAVNHGFWKGRLSNEHCLMLVITEVGELVEADRKKRHAKIDRFVEDGKEYPEFIGRFEDWIKDTVEDEFADIAIRLFDLAGALGVDFDKMNPCRYHRAFDKFNFAENAFALCKGLARDVIGIEKRIQFGVEYVKKWAESLNIDLGWHIDNKMNYNETRPILHGKGY